jgi:hypothetical protein
MAAKVTFVEDGGKSVKFSLFGPAKDSVKVAKVLRAFMALAVFIGNDMLEEDDQGNSMDPFNAGTTYTITVICRIGDSPSASTCFIKISEWISCKVQVLRISIDNLCFLSWLCCMRAMVFKDLG